MAFGDVVSTFSSVFGFLTPWHLLSYSALVGMELYQSFVMTKLAHISLPQPAFHSLQKRVFPIYFRAQTALLVLTAASFPTHGPSSLVQHKADWIPFLIAGITAVLNMTIYAPRTSQAMVERVHQKTRDALKGVEEGEVTPEMHSLNRAFKKNHAMSIHLNLISIGAMLFYGWRLALRIKLE